MKKNMNKVKITTAGQTKSEAKATSTPQNGKRKKRFKLAHNVIGAGFTSFFTDIATKMIYSVMPLYLLSIGTSTTTIALIEGFAESTASILKAASGFISDKIGKSKPFMVIGYGLAALVIPLYTFVSSPFQVLLIRFTERVGKSIRSAPRDSLISNSIKKKATGRSFGFQKMMDDSGAIIGPLIACIILYFLPGHYHLVFFLAIVPAIFGVLSVIFLIKEVHLKHLHEESFKSVGNFKKLSRKYYQFLLVIFIFSLGNSSDALLLVKAATTGIDSVYIPFIFMLFSTTSVVCAMPVGKLSDKLGRHNLMALGFLIYAISYFFFGRYCNILVFIPLFIFYGIYSALADVNQKSLVSDITTPETKGTGFGLYHATLGLTLLPASFIGGWLYDNVNNQVPFYFGALTAVTASILMFWFFRHGTSTPDVKKSYQKENAGAAPK